MGICNNHYLRGDCFDCHIRADTPMNTTWNPNGLKTVCVDFNGVLDTYTGFKPGYMYPPRAGAKEFLAELAKTYDVIVLTAMDAVDVTNWLAFNDMMQYVKQITSRKPPAIAYVDDRAICFNGNFNTVLETLHNFKTFWETEECSETPKR